MATRSLPGLALGCAFLLAACRGRDDGTVRLPAQAPTQRGGEPPVLVNPQPPVEYPPALFEQGIEGKVILRLFVTESGTVLADSTRVAESSGYPAMDSAALRAVPQFRFTPAVKNGTPVAALFLQPVHFQHPQAGGTTP